MSAALLGILGFCAALPKIIGWIEAGITAIGNIADSLHRQAKAQEAANAIKYAEITKDTSKLEALFNPPASK